jgi:hypothetical protein
MLVKHFEWKMWLETERYAFKKQLFVKKFRLHVSVLDDVAQYGA